MAKLDLSVRYASPEAAARAYASAAGLARLDNATASAARLEAAGRLRRDESGAYLLTEQPPQKKVAHVEVSLRRVPSYAQAVHRRDAEEIVADGRAGAFRGPGQEILSATRAALRDLPQGTATADTVAAYLTGWPGLPEVATPDLAASALRALRERGEALQARDAPFAWSPAKRR